MLFNARRRLSMFSPFTLISPFTHGLCRYNFIGYGGCLIVDIICAPDGGTYRAGILFFISRRASMFIYITGLIEAKAIYIRYFSGRVEYRLKIGADLMMIRPGLE